MKLNYNRIIKSFATVILSLTFISVSFSQLTVSKLFSDNCILQRDVVIPVTGKASPNGNVYLKFNDRKYSTTADTNGNWTIELPEMKATLTSEFLTYLTKCHHCHKRILKVESGMKLRQIA